MVEDSNEQLEQIYNHVWASNRGLLRDNRIVIDEDPKEGSLRWGVTLVFRPDPNSLLIQNLNNVNQHIKERVGTDHMFLDTGSYHCTVKALDGFRENIPDNDHFVSTYCDKIAQITDLPKFEITYKGLFASNTGIYAKGWVNDSGIKILREAIDEALADVESKYTNPDKNRQRNTCHISLAVFKSNHLTNPQGIVDYIEKENNAVYGNLLCDKLELVSYTLKKDKVSVNTIATF
ncbi:MAG: hypothetical protein ACTHXT_10450 [Sphingobacterium sp.]